MFVKSTKYAVMFRLTGNAVFQSVELFEERREIFSRTEMPMWPDNSGPTKKRNFKKLIYCSAVSCPVNYFFVGMMVSMQLKNMR